MKKTIGTLVTIATLIIIILTGMAVNAIFKGMNPDEVGTFQVTSIIIAWVAFIVVTFAAAFGGSANGAKVATILAGIAIGVICGNAVFDLGTTFWLSALIGVVGLVLAGLNADAFR